MDTPTAIIGQVVVVAEDDFPEVSRNMLFVPTREALIQDQSLSCGLYLRPVDYAGAQGLVASLACVAPATARRAALRLGQGLVCGFALEAAWAQEPIESSRVELSGERDRFGVPRVNLHWEKSTFDIHTLHTAGERLARYFADQDSARVHLDNWVVEEEEFPDDGVTGNFHHMGGTRMSDSPATGVVDRNCRVFGKDNLYIAGSSVFPAVGHVNPTFTILQLALRLSDELLQA
jgi:choline dehydrogenase-like flavoprotein